MLKPRGTNARVFAERRAVRPAFGSEDENTVIDSFHGRSEFTVHLGTLDTTVRVTRYDVPQAFASVCIDNGARFDHHCEVNLIATAGDVEIVRTLRDALDEAIEYLEGREGS